MTRHGEGRDEGLLMVVKHHRVDTMCYCSCITDQQCICQHCKRLIASGVNMSCGLGKHQHQRKHKFSGSHRVFMRQQVTTRQIHCTQGTAGCSCENACWVPSLQNIADATRGLALALGRLVCSMCWCFSSAWLLHVEQHGAMPVLQLRLAQHGQRGLEGLKKQD